MGRRGFLATLAGLFGLAKAERGTIHEAKVFDRALTPAEVEPLSRGKTRWVGRQIFVDYGAEPPTVTYFDSFGGRSS